jgi:hypothetical protein
MKIPCIKTQKYKLINLNLTKKKNTLIVEKLCAL